VGSAKWNWLDNFPTTLQDNLSSCYRCLLCDILGINSSAIHDNHQRYHLFRIYHWNNNTGVCPNMFHTYKKYRWNNKQVTNMIPLMSTLFWYELDESTTFNKEGKEPCKHSNCHVDNVREAMTYFLTKTANLLVKKTFNTIIACL